MLGIKPTKHTILQTIVFDTVPLIDLIKVIEEEAQGYNPSIVFTHHGGDLNVDHQQVFKAVMTAFRPIESQQVKTNFNF